MTQVCFINDIYHNNHPSWDAEIRLLDFLKAKLTIIYHLCKQACTNTETVLLIPFLQSFPLPGDFPRTYIKHHNDYAVQKTGCI